MSEAPKSTTITDAHVLRIIEWHRRRLGDKTTAKTAGRIIQAFQAAGLELTPDLGAEPQPIDADHGSAAPLNST